MPISNKIGILFLHGYTGGRYELEPLFIYLKTRYTFEYEFPVYPGHGNVLDLKETTGADWYQEAYDSYLHLSLRVDEVIIIGYSMGGVFASHIAQHFEVEKLILIAPAFDHTKLTQLSKLHLSPRVLSAHMKLNAYNQVKKRLRDIPPKAFMEFSMIVEEKAPGFENIESETLIVHGTIDLLVPYITSVEVASKMKYCKLELIEDAPHLFSFTDEKQLELNIIVERFLFTKPMNVLV